jgi:hypothetical protein
LIVDSTGTFSGRAFQFQANLPAGNFINARMNPTVLPVAASAATQYSVTVKVRAVSAAGSRTARVAFNAFRTSGTVFISTFASQDAIAIPTDGSWATMTLTGTTPALTETINTDVRINAGVLDDELFEIGDLCFRAGADTTFVPSMRIVGDLDMRARFAATDATPASAEALIGHRSGNNGYAMTLGTGGELVVYHGTGSGTRAETSSGLSLVAATDTEVRSVIDISAGTWTHYKNGVQFDTSGSFATTAGSPYAGPLAVGADSAGTSGNWDGDIYYAEVRDGIDGPVVRRFDADDLIGLT